MFPGLYAQEIPSNKVVSTEDLPTYLNAEVKKNWEGKKLFQKLFWRNISETSSVKDIFMTGRILIQDSRNMIHFIPVSGSTIPKEH